MLARALRLDKLTLAALEATLRLPGRGALAEIPTLAMLAPAEALRPRAERCAQIEERVAAGCARPPWCPDRPLAAARCPCATSTRSRCAWSFCAAARLHASGCSCAGATCR
ncbi:MAG: hypothetical protein ACLSVD_19400 [Eggerthellaceae bacterium]